MPFRSEKQRRFLWANHPDIARRWTNEYGSAVRPSGNTSGMANGMNRLARRLAVNTNKLSGFTATATKGVGTPTLRGPGKPTIGRVAVVGAHRRTSRGPGKPGRRRKPRY